MKKMFLSSIIIFASTTGTFAQEAGKKFVGIEVALNKHNEFKQDKLPSSQPNFLTKTSHYSAANTPALKLEAGQYLDKNIYSSISLGYNTSEYKYDNDWQNANNTFSNQKENIKVKSFTVLANIGHDFELKNDFGIFAEAGIGIAKHNLRNVIQVNSVDTSYGTITYNNNISGSRNVYSPAYQIGLGVKKKLSSHPISLKTSINYYNYGSVNSGKATGTSTLTGNNIIATNSSYRDASKVQLSGLKIAFGLAYNF